VRKKNGTTDLIAYNKLLIESKKKNSKRKRKKNINTGKIILFLNINKKISRNKKKVIG
jgi:hypothetical protein